MYLADMRDTIEIVHVAVDVLLGVGLWWIGQKARAIGTLEGKIGDQEDKLHGLATKLIDERFRAISHEMKSHVQGFVSTLDLLKERLKEGDAQIDTLGGSDHRLELKLEGKFGELKDWIRDTCAVKSDLRLHEQQVNERAERMRCEVQSLAKEVAVLSDRMVKKN